MPSYTEIKDTLIVRLYDLASKPRGPSEFTGQEIQNLIGDVTGAGVSNTLVWELLGDGLLSQTGAIIDDEGGTFSITAALIRLAEEIQNKPPQPSPKGKFTQFWQLLLVNLAKQEAKHGPNYYDLKSIADESGIAYSEGWIRKAGNHFRDHGYIKASFTLGGGIDGNMGAQLTASGLELAEEIGIPEDELNDSIPAAGRFVQITHNSDEFKNAERTIESAIDAIEGSNEKSYEEKEPILSAIKTGWTYIKTHKTVIFAALSVFILEPLKTAYNSFAETRLLELIDQAITAIKILMAAL